MSKSEIDWGRVFTGSRFMFNLKNFGTRAGEANVRCVDQGYYNQDQCNIVFDTTTFHAASARLVLSVFALFEFERFSHDVTQAYFQSKYEVLHHLYIRRKPEDSDIFGVQINEKLKLIKPSMQPAKRRATGEFRWRGTVYRELSTLPSLGDSVMHAMKRTNEDIGMTG